MRLFTAIELPADIRARLEEIQGRLAGLPELKGAVVWPKGNNLHVTLKFFGDVEDPQVPALTTALASLPVPAMAFTVERFLCLPPRGPARVLAGSLAGDTRVLADLFGKIEAACQPLGFPREGREYKPHVTLGRFRSPSNRHTAQSLIRLVDPALLPTAAFGVEKFVLMQSVLDPRGAIYTPVAHFPRAT